MSTFTDKDHTENLQQQLWQQRENEELCDIQLIVGVDEKRISAHRCVLSAASEYLKELALGSTSNEIQLPQLDGDILYSLIEYCYTGRIVITLTTIEQLLVTAKVLALRNVMSACADFLVEQFNSSNCLKFTTLLAENDCETQLQKLSMKHFMEIRATNALLQLKAAQLGKLLASDELAIPTEEVAFESLMAWIEHDRNEREKHQAELLKLIRIPLVQRSFLFERVKPVCTSTECLKVLLEAMELHERPQSGLPKARKSIKPAVGLLAITQNPMDHYERYIKFYCPQQRTWNEWPKSFKLNAQISTAKIEDKLYILGGTNAKRQTTKDVMCLNIQTMLLTEVAQMTECRANCGAAVLKGYLYAVGGYGAAGEDLSSVEKFCPYMEKWSKVASIQSFKGKLGLAVLNEKLYVIVISVTGNSGQLQCYDPYQNAWIYLYNISNPEPYRHPWQNNHIYPGRLNHVFISNTDFQLTGQMTIANDKVCIIGIHKSKPIVKWSNPDAMSGKIECDLPGCLTSLFATGLWTTFSDKIIVCSDNTIVEYDDVHKQWKTNTSLKLANLEFVFSYGH